jgi:hypothetical protein
MRSYIKYRGDLQYEFRDTRTKDKSTTAIIKNRHTQKVVDRIEADMKYLLSLDDA